MTDGIFEEGMVDQKNVDVQIVQEVWYVETSFLDGSYSTQETKNYVGLVDVTKNLGS